MCGFGHFIMAGPTSVQHGWQQPFFVFLMQVNPMQRQLVLHQDQCGTLLIFVSHEQNVSKGAGTPFLCAATENITKPLT